MKRVQDPDYDLLLNDPQRLLVNYQPLIRSCVWHFVGKGVFHASQIADTVQSVNEELLLRIPKLQTGYNGSFLVKTYVAATVRNICLRLKANSNRTVPVDPIEKADFQGQSSFGMDRYSIDQAKKLLHAITLQYHSKRPKLVVCLKLWCRLPLTRGEILDWYQDCSEEVLDRILGRFGIDYSSMTDAEVFRVASGLFKSGVETQNPDDALRKWTQTKTEELIELLNGEPPTKSFDRESLQLLLHEYFSPFLLEE